MSKQKQTKPVTKAKNTREDERVSKYQSEWQNCDSALSKIRDEWRENEAIFFNDDKGEAATDSKSNVNDGHLSTAVIQRTQRISAQPATGKVEYLDRKDRGKNQLLNLILQRYIIPNSNAQYKHLMKIKLTSVYSQIYGKQPVLVDYVVSDDYVGPDFWLIPVDRYYPQPGVFQDDDQDYCFVDTLQTLGSLKNLSKSTWKNIDLLVKAIKDKKSKVSYVNQTSNEEKYSVDFEGVLLRTKYEREKWITYAPDFPQIGILREIDNPHKNGRLPIVVKQTFPLLDRATGWSDTERGKPLQLTQNSLVNLSLDSAKNKLFPTVIVNPRNVVKPTLKREYGAIWEELVPNSIRPLVNGNEDINTFNNLSGYVLSSLNNLLGTTDLSVSKNVDMNMGKTPQALKMQQIKESAADAWERQSLEDFVEELYDRMIELLSVNQPKPIDLNLFGGEIEQISEIYPDIEEVAEVKGQGKYRIKPEMIKGKFRFFIDAGTTVQKDSLEENQSLTAIIQLITQNPQIRQELQAKGKDIDMAELIKRWVITTGVKDSDKIMVDFQPEPQMDQNMAQNMPNPMPETSPQPQEQTNGQIPTQDSSQVMPNLQDPAIQQAAMALLGGRR